jgi:hypothetical protein
MIGTERDVRENYNFLDVENNYRLSIFNDGHKLANKMGAMAS